jgi:hypothetical protein
MFPTKYVSNKICFQQKLIITKMVRKGIITKMVRKGILVCITGNFSNKLCGKKFVQNNLRSPHGQHCKEVFALTDLVCANDEQIFNWVSCSTWFRYRNQGCQIFLGTAYQNGEKYTKYSQIIPNIHRIHQKAQNIPNGRRIDLMALIIPTSFIAKPS